ncbi:hypothetical protein EfmAA94_18850 [Enterococcus faecium]|nr:hypothetical protein EfmAA94_18850 [Enterococcus faecium]
MTYTHLTTDELVIIESYFKMNQSVAKTAHCLNRSRQTTNNSCARLTSEIEIDDLLFEFF